MLSQIPTVSVGASELKELRQGAGRESALSFGTSRLYSPCKLSARCRKRETTTCPEAVVPFFAGHRLLPQLQNSVEFSLRITSNAMSSDPPPLTTRPSERPLIPCGTPGCLYASAYSFNLRRHRRAKHPERPLSHFSERPLIACGTPGCPYASADSSNLRRHRRAKHSELGAQPAPLVACGEPGCSFSTNDSSNLARHRRTRHSPELRVQPLSSAPLLSCLEDDDRNPFDLPATRSLEASFDHEDALIRDFEHTVLEEATPRGVCCVCDLRLRGTHSEPVVYFPSAWHKLNFLANGVPLEARRGLRLNAHNPAFQSLHCVPLSAAGMHLGGVPCQCKGSPRVHHVVVCETCNSAIDRGARPPLAVADNWLGRIPDCFQVCLLVLISFSDECSSHLLFWPPGPNRMRKIGVVPRAAQNHSAATQDLRKSR